MFMLKDLSLGSLFQFRESASCGLVVKVSSSESGDNMQQHGFD